MGAPIESPLSLTLQEQALGVLGVFAVVHEGHDWRILDVEGCDVSLLSCPACEDMRFMTADEVESVLTLFDPREGGENGTN